MSKQPKVDINEGYDFLHRIPPEMMEEYYYALGKFMHMFAVVEASLNSLVSVFVNQHHEPKYTNSLFVMQAVLGAQRLKGTTDTIKRLLRVTVPYNITQEEKDAIKARDIEVTKLLNHLGEIHFLRDRLAHHGADVDQTNKEGWFRTHNFVAVRENDDFGQIKFKPKMLLDAARDLQVIQFRLSRVVMAELFPTPDFSGYPSQVKAEADRNGPWHYKPSLLKREGPRFRRSQQAPARQQQPSPPSPSRKIRQKKAVKKKP